MTPDYRGAIYLSVAASIWGGVYVASKYVLEVIPPFTLLFIRYFLAAITLLWWCRREQISVIPKQDKWTLFQIGFFGYFLSIAAQFIGTKLSSAHMGAVITTLSPVFQSGFAIVLLGEKISLRQIGALLFSFIGVLIITGVSGLGDETYNWGSVFLLVAACLWGYYSVLSKQIALRHPALRITTWGILLATLLTLPPALMELPAWDMASLSSWPVQLSIFYLAFISTTMAYYYWNAGLALTNPHQAGLFIFLQSVVGSIFGYLLLDEMLSLSFFIGSVLVLLGVYLSLGSDDKVTKVRNSSK